MGSVSRSRENDAAAHGEASRARQEDAELRHEGSHVAHDDPTRCEWGEHLRLGARTDVAMGDDPAGAAGSAVEHASRESTAELPRSAGRVEATPDGSRERQFEEKGSCVWEARGVEALERGGSDLAAMRKHPPSAGLRGPRSFQNITLLLALREVAPGPRRSANFRPLWDRLWTGQRVLEAEHSPPLHAARRWGLALPSNDRLAGPSSMGSGDLEYRNGHVSGDWLARGDGAASEHPSGSEQGFRVAAHAPVRGMGPRADSVPVWQQGQSRGGGQQICRCWSEAAVLAGGKGQSGPMDLSREQQGPLLPQCSRQLPGTCAVHGPEPRLPEGHLLRHTIDTHRALRLWVERDSIKHYVAHYCPLFPPPRSTIAAAFSPNGATLASTHGDHTVKVLSCSNGQRMKTLTGHRRTPWVVRYNPCNPDVVASGSLDHEVRLWSLVTAQSFASHAFYRPIASLAFHARGTLLAVASGRHLYIWEHTRSGEESQPVIILKTRRSLRAVHFHPHGAPLLLTAEVNALEPADCPPSEALSSGYQDYPPPTLHFADGAGGTVSAPPELESPGDGTDLEGGPWQAAHTGGATQWQGDGEAEGVQASWHRAGEHTQPVEQGVRSGEDEPQLLPQNAEELSGRASEERDQRYLQVPPMQHQPLQQGRGGGAPPSQLLGMAPRWPQWLWRSDSGPNAGASPSSGGAPLPAEAAIPTTQALPESAVRAEGGSGPVQSIQRRYRGGAELGTADDATGAQQEAVRARRRVTAQDGKEEAGMEGEGQAQGQAQRQEGEADVDMGEAALVTRANRDPMGTAHGGLENASSLDAQQTGLAPITSSCSALPGCSPQEQQGSSNIQKIFSIPGSHYSGEENGAALPMAPTDRGAADLARLHLQDTSGTDLARANQGAGAAQQLHAGLGDGGTPRAAPVSGAVGAHEVAPHGAGEAGRGVHQQQQIAEQTLPAAQPVIPEAERRDPQVSAARTQGSRGQVTHTQLQQLHNRAGANGTVAGDAYDLGGMRDSLGPARPREETLSRHRLQPQQIPHWQAQRHSTRESLQLHAQQQPPAPQQQHPSSQNPEVPCTVKLRLWTHCEDRPKKELDPASCRLSIPHAVLCSEMGAHFSPCGRFLAACVACVPRPNDPAWVEASPIGLGVPRWDSAGLGIGEGWPQQGPPDARQNGSSAGRQPLAARGEADPPRRREEIPRSGGQPTLRTRQAEWDSATGREQAQHREPQLPLLHAHDAEQGLIWGSHPQHPLGWGGYAHRVGRTGPADGARVQDSTAVPGGGPAEQALPAAGQRQPSGAGGVPLEPRPSDGGASGAGSTGAQGKASWPIVYELRIYSVEGPLFGQVLAARGVRAAHCLTSVQFSPTSTHLLLAYGRRHSSLLRSIVVDGPLVVPVYTILEVYRVSDMSLVHVLTSSDDEVNVASFHPSVGSGLVYGTKEGKLRLFQHSRVPDPVQPPYGLPLGLDLTDLAGGPRWNAWTRAALAADQEEGAENQH